MPRTSCQDRRLLLPWDYFRFARLFERVPPSSVLLRSAHQGRASEKALALLGHDPFQGPGATLPVCQPDTWLGTGKPRARQEFLELRVRPDSVPLVIQ